MGMAEYIEREAFIESQQHLYCENCARRKDGKGKFVYDIGDAPCRACGIMDTKRCTGRIAIRTAYRTAIQMQRRASDE